ncbi:MAG: hypothetical protein L0Z62_46800 [Gemmataceae bacterium]|nr:hypothetical protein [Gemmataceae bacterium]
MKKLLLVGLLSMTAVIGNTSALHARLFQRCFGGRFACKIHVRPYNAFSPICFGTFNCVGGFPGGGPMFGPPGPPMHGPYAAAPFDHCPEPCHDGACPVLPPAHPGGAPADSGGNSGPKFTPPSPTPLNSTSYYYPGVMPYAPTGVQPAAYQMGYGMQPAPYGYQPHYAGYAPGYGMGYYPMMPSYTAPSYWYGAQQ